MAFSIPQTIYPVFNSNIVHNNLDHLDVGKGVQDLPSGAETEMKQSHDIESARIQKQYTQDLAQYEHNFQSASVKATKASTLIDGALKKQAIAITLLVASIVAVVGIAVASIVTGTWPIAFIAVPFLIAIVPTSYYTDIFRKLVDTLEGDIKAPGRLRQPILELPVYNPRKDLDLAQSRMSAQNEIAFMTLQQIAESEWSNDEIIRYALLDKVAPLTSEQRPAFYSKCIQLINEYGKIVKEQNRYLDSAESEYKRIKHELKEWKNQQEEHIRLQEHTFHHQYEVQVRLNHARRRTGRLLVTPHMSMGRVLSRWDLERMKAEVAEGYGRRDNEIRNWHKNTLHVINSTALQAKQNIEWQFASVKR